MSKTLRERAITLLKDGRTADELRVLFVAEGARPDEVRAVLDELVQLQRRAVALDPARLRGEANWMFARGASVDHVVAHFAQAGVSEEHARPEAERLFAMFRTMRPCQRCGTPTPPAELVFDLRGLSICSSCNLRDEIHRSEQRAVVSDLESLAVLGGVGMAITAQVVGNAIENDPGAAPRPFCAHCRTPSGVLVVTLPPEWRARLDPRWVWVCPTCWQPIA
ncbi:MAG TPA: hypothetical protein VGH28_06640 [Polyangiaceae bacterium]|jgi:hypothetical protein